MRRVVPIVCCVFLVACSKLLGLDDYQYAEARSAGDEPDANTSDQSSSEGSPEVGPAACELATPPPRLNINADAGGNLELTFVMRTIDFGDDSTPDRRSDGGAHGYQRLGYDLDGRCTSGGDPPTCTNASRMGPREDGVGGIDNATGEMVASIKGAFGVEILSSATVNGEVEAGLRAPTVIFQVRGYNGFYADDHVDVDWYLPVLPGQREGGSGDAGSPPPKWDGTDIWPIQPPSFAQALPNASSPDTPPIAWSSVDGYVSNYRLVARFPDGIPFRLAAIVVRLFDATLTVDILPNAMSKPYEVRNGLVTGRATRRDVFANIPVMTTVLSGQPICTDNAVYAGFRNWVCTFPDLTSKSTDGALPSCDMFSLGLAFVPALAVLGTTVEVPPFPKLCPPETDPANETCDPSDASVGP